MADPSVDDVGGVVATLDRLGSAAVAGAVGAAPELGHIRTRVRRRRARRRSLGALAALVPVLVALVVWRVGAGSESSQRVTTDSPKPHPATAAAVREEPLEVSSRPMAPSPLSARRAPASVWTGSELFVWGGEATGDGLRPVELDDGAAYDPETDRWRTVSPSPLGPRARAAAIWTGSEVIVWGGESDGHRNGLTTGAAYDPKTDSWRTIAPAPGRSGRGYPSTALADHWLVVGGGTKTPPGTDVLIYDLETDTWDEVELRDVDVQQVVATDDLVAVVGVDPSLDPSGPKPQGADGRPTDRARTDRLLVRWLAPATRHLERAPDLTLAGQPAAVAAHWAGGALTAAVTTLVPVDGNPGGSNPGPGAVATVEPNSGWYRRRTIPPPTSLLEPVGFGYQLPTLWAWTGRSVVTVPLGSVATFDPETGVERVRHRQREDTEDIYPTGFDAAQAWTGSEVLLWGGESGSGGGELAIGARLRPEP